MNKKEHDKIVKEYLAVIKHKDTKIEESIKIADNLEREVVELTRECGRYSKTIEDQLITIQTSKHEADRAFKLCKVYESNYEAEQEKVAEAHKKVGQLRVQVSEEQVKYNNAVEVFADIIKELS